MSSTATKANPTKSKAFKQGRRALIAIFAALIVMGAIVVALLSPQAPQPSAIGGSFTLQATTGETFTEKSLLGKPTLIFFGYTHCPDICPTTLFDLSQLMQQPALKDKNLKPRVIFVTVDPARDTPQTMKEYLSNFDKDFIGLSGDDTHIDAIVKAYRVYAKKGEVSGNDYTMDHSAFVYLLDKNGHFAEIFRMDRPADESAKELVPYF